MSAAEVLAGVAEYGPNYSLPQPAESKTARRKRLRLDAAARIAGHAVVEAGTHVEILGEHRWWPGTITGREEGSDGRLVHAVEYDGYPEQDFRLNLEEVSWRRATLGAGGAAPTSGEVSDGEGSDKAADALPASATDIGSAVATGGEGSGVEGGGGDLGNYGRAGCAYHYQGNQLSESANAKRESRDARHCRSTRHTERRCM